MNLDCENLFAKEAKKKRHIKQGYLSFSKGMSLRIREVVDWPDYDRFKLTYKQKASNRVIEIETDIEERDFEELWNIAVNRLEKIRYDIKAEDKQGQKSLWEVDCFKDHNHQTYAILAEHEMPEDMEEPDFIPKIIRKNLIYAVPRTDDRFASKKLADVKYTQKLYKTILESLS